MMARSDVVEAFEQQAAACRRMGSDFTARMLEACLRDLEADGPVATVLASFDGHPVLDALCQRLVGAVQGLVLAGEAPELARYYPTEGGTPVWPEAGEAFVATIAAHADAIRPRLAEQVQTNEVRRCAGLLGGFLTIARETGLPLRLREIGSSAGLILFWDRYRYELGPHRWGDPNAPVTITTEWTGGAPPLDAAVEVASRIGCDIHPIDATDPVQLRRIQSFYWVDQVDRIALLRAAAAALEGPAPIERIRAGDFVAREVGSRPSGEATVLYHSTMWWYLPDGERAAVSEVMEAAGAEADATRPLAWLRSEPPNMDHVEVRLRLWPGGEDRLLAQAHHHGAWVDWIADVD
jgi:hypothetical protein